MATCDNPPANVPLPHAALSSEASDRLRILGVDVLNPDLGSALRLVSPALQGDPSDPQALYFVNAHTLNNAAADPTYRRALNRARFVLGDGTGVRWAARLQGVRMRANLNGTDFIPALLEATSGRGYRCYLLGATPDTIGRTLEAARARFPGWLFVGCQHGFLDVSQTADTIAEINSLAPNLLLVAMGNPLQERWIDAHLAELRVPLSVGVGGLFNFWSHVRRAPRWVRKLGCEWLFVMTQQPAKWRRYVYGNPLFMARVAAERLKLRSWDS